MRKALRPACASPMPHSRPSRRASSTGTYSTRLVILPPLFDRDSRELRDLPVLHELVAYERAELLGCAGPRLDAELRIGAPDFGHADGLHDDLIQPPDDVFRNRSGHEHAVPPITFVAEESGF